MSDNEKTERKGALGKGIHSLLGDASLDSWQLQRPRSQAPSSPNSTDTKSVKLSVHEVETALIEPNPEQPRRVFKEEELRSLAASITQDGIIQPLIVMTHKQEAGRFILIAGERRLRAAKLAGLSTVPVLIKETSLDERLRIALIENIQRAELNIIEEAQAYRASINEYGLTQEQCAQKVGKERSTVTNALRILNLPRVVQEDLMAERLSMGHAKALLSLEDEALILQARELVLKKQLSVRKTELLCKSLLKDGLDDSAMEATKEIDPDMEYIADNLRAHLRTKVKLAGSSQRGKIEISYFSASELERLLELIGQKL